MVGSFHRFGGERCLWRKELQAPAHLPALSKAAKRVYFGQILDTLRETPCLQNKDLNNTVTRDMACFLCERYDGERQQLSLPGGKKIPKKQEGENNQDPPPLAQGRGSASLIFPCTPHP